MSKTPEFEIPQTMREIAERNVEQARSAYAQFADMAKKAQETASKSTDVMAESTRELQSRTMSFAQDHVEASFQLAADLAKARDFKDYLEIQARYAQRQMASYTEQAQELGKMMGDIAQTAQKKR